jgi:hypothetical protein
VSARVAFVVTCGVELAVKPPVHLGHCAWPALTVLKYAGVNFSLFREDISGNGGRLFIECLEKNYRGVRPQKVSQVEVSPDRSMPGPG